MMDFPRAWQIFKASPIDSHHPECSWLRMGLLCDCDVITKHPEYLDDALHGLDGEILTPKTTNQGERDE